MLLARVEDEPVQARPFEVNAWMALVTGVLEHLKPDVMQPECLALMTVSVGEPLKSEAAAHIGQDANVTDRLRAAYTEWMIVEDLLDEFDEWAKSRLSQGMLHYPIPAKRSGFAHGVAPSLNSGIALCLRCSSDRATPPTSRPMRVTIAGASARPSGSRRRIGSAARALTSARSIRVRRMRIFPVTCRCYNRPVLEPMGKRAFGAVGRAQKSAFTAKPPNLPLFLPVRPMTRSPPNRERAYAPSLGSKGRVSTSFGPKEEGFARSGFETPKDTGLRRPKTWRRRSYTDR